MLRKKMHLVGEKQRGVDKEKQNHKRGAIDKNF